MKSGHHIGRLDIRLYPTATMAAKG